ncbi:hypothetical protein [Brevundimonas sp.]|uniref:hypothetical protein n=1 Tax=Brevundimonas sp. TaxID=1871086 RepID=UPI00289C71B2|nr:hypothetical protein [Brevundimonas sp.]
MTVLADQVARALVIEARKAGVDPVRVFEPELRFVRAKVARVQPTWGGMLRLNAGAAA